MSPENEFLAFVGLFLAVMVVAVIREHGRGRWW
jgi:hypothetical protein